ncbi:MAG: hypothetical protein ABIY51_00085 [Ferruginibacter sp.]
MSNDLKNILSNLNPGIEQEKLLQYLNNHLDASEAHEVEKQLNEDPFLNDAMEGLQELKQKSTLPVTLHQLNKNLKKQINSSKKKRAEKISFQQPWIYYTIIILLVLCVIAYVVITRF